MASPSPSPSPSPSLSPVSQPDPWELSRAHARARAYYGLKYRGYEKAFGKGWEVIQNPLKAFFKFLLWVVLFTVGLFLVYVIGFTIYSLAFTNAEFTSGFLGGYGVQVYTWLQKTSPEFAQGLAQAYAAIKNPEAEYTREQLQGDAPVKKVRERREILVADFGAYPAVFRSQTPILLSIDVAARNIPLATRLGGTCSFEQRKNELGLKSNRELVPAPIVFEAGTDVLEKEISEQHAYGSCEFREGALYQANDFTKLITAKIRYRTASIAFWKFYYIHSAHRAGNPRELIKDSDLKSDGVMRTTPAYESAMSISFGAEPQPYYEDRQRVVRVLFFKNTGVDGVLEKLHSLKVIAPVNFAFLENEQCDFEQAGGDEGGNTAYVVKPAVLKEIDVDCGNPELAKGILGKENCERIYKNDLQFSCGFEVRDIDAGLQSPQYGVLKAEADYDFVTYGRTTIQVLEQPLVEGSL